MRDVKNWIVIGAAGIILFATRNLWRGFFDGVSNPAAAVNVNVTPVYAQGENRRWEINESMPGWKPFKGDKPWNTWWLNPIGDWLLSPIGMMINPPAGFINVQTIPTTGRQRGSCGSWFPPEGTKIYYVPAKQYMGSIKGDPRFLYCLDALMRTASLTRIDHGGVVNWNLANGDSGHDYGYAIDLYDDKQMNAMVEAAKILNMPILWISKTKAPAGWPVFRLINGEKVNIGHTSVNHNSHFHLVLPRPNSALQFIKIGAGGPPPIT